MGGGQANFKQSQLSRCFNAERCFANKLHQQQLTNQIIKCINFTIFSSQKVAETSAMDADTEALLHSGVGCVGGFFSNDSLCNLWLGTGAGHRQHQQPAATSITRRANQTPQHRLSNDNFRHNFRRGRRREDVRGTSGADYVSPTRAW